MASTIQNLVSCLLLLAVAFKASSALFWHSKLGRSHWMASSLSVNLWICHMTALPLNYTCTEAFTNWHASLTLPSSYCHLVIFT